jgi:hypothetical protein
MNEIDFEPGTIMEIGQIAPKEYKKGADTFFSSGIGIPLQ